MADESESLAFSGEAPPKTGLLPTLALIAGLWTISDVGYYYLLPAMGQNSTYNDGPIGVALYYVFWTGIAVIAFWPLYATWPRYAN